MGFLMTTLRTLQNKFQKGCNLIGESCLVCCEAMKDGYKRRREAERHLIKTLPDVDPNVIFTPTRQELIDVGCQVMDARAQGNEFIVTMNKEWWIEAYEISKNSRSPCVDIDLLSEVSDDKLVPQSQLGKSLWCAMPRAIDCAKYGDLTFAAPDIVVCIIPDTPPLVCTFYARTGELLAKVNVSEMCSLTSVSKISDNEFVVGSENGNLYFFAHDEGRNLKETARVRKAHMDAIWSLSYYKDVVVSASADWTAQLWATQTKKRIAILHHDQAVEDVAIVSEYIVTCSRYSRMLFRKGEVRIYKNGDGYALLKILRHTHSVGNVKIVNHNHIVCQHFGPWTDNNEKIERDLIMVIDIERGCIVAQLKVGCRVIYDYTVLVDGRLVAVGSGGCRGVIATFPRRVRELICETVTKRALGWQIPCSLM